MNSTGFGKRHIQYILLFFGGAIAFLIRASLSVAIVAMTDDNPPHPDIPTYPNWNNEDVILSSFFWGYVVLQIPAGFIGFKYGAKYFLGNAFLIASVFTTLSPWMAAKLGSYGMILSRIVQGLSQGFIFPSIHGLLSKWTPLPEQSRTFTFVYASGFIGTTISMPLSGYICASSYGWPYVFYLSGILGLIWSISFLIICKNSPEDHSGLSVEERLYLEQNIPGRNDDKELSVPWLSIFTSIHFWAIIAAHCGNNYGFFLLFAEIPSYFQEILKFNMESNCMLSALPFLISFIFSLVLSPISDSIIGRNILSIQNSRKLFNLIGSVGPAIALVCLGFIPTGMKFLGVLLLILTISLNAAIFVGFNVNHVDLSPNFAGVLMGCTNCMAQVASILGPLSVHFVISDKSDPTQWRTIFLITAGVLTFAGIFFSIFASGEIQPWNDGKEAKNKGNTIADYEYTTVGIGIQLDEAEKRRLSLPGAQI